MAGLQIQGHVLLPCEAVFERLEHLGYPADFRSDLIDAAQIGAGIEVATGAVASIKASIKRGVPQIAATRAAGSTGEVPIIQSHVVCLDRRMGAILRTPASYAHHFDEINPMRQESAVSANAPGIAPARPTARAGASKSSACNAPARCGR